MPLVSRPDLADLYTAVLDGRVRLVAWGAIDWVLGSVWQCPLPIAYFVDSNPALWGTTFLGRPVHPPDRLRDEPPATTAVMVHYHFGRSYYDVTAFLDEIGPFRHIVPDLLDQAFRSADGGQDDDAVSLTRLRDLVAFLTGLADLERARALTSLGLTEERWRRFSRLLANQRRRLDPAARPQTAVLLAEQLYPGGAERQLCELAVGLKRRGWTVTVVTLRSSLGPALHYIDRLRAAGVDCLAASPPTHDEALRAAARGDAEAALALWHLPGNLVTLGFAAVHMLRMLRPELLISYLDRPNVIGGVAGIITGVPRLFLSGRNLHPGHFPHLFDRQPDNFRRIYRILAELPGVALSANSGPAAASYAEWLDVPRQRITVVPNAVAEEALAPMAADAVAEMRRRMAPPGHRIILGVFRLSPEKQPELFPRVLARLTPFYPDLHGVICGDGALRPALEAQAAALGIADRLTLLGVVETVPAAMRAADLLLHTSLFEGMPNVLLEAQALGLPAVSTRSGGSEEALAPDLLAHAHAVDDLEGLVASCRRLLDDEDLRRSLGAAGIRHIHANHSLERLVEGTLAAAGLQ